MLSESSPPPALVAAIASIAVLWIVEMRFFYWPLPKNRVHHAGVNIVGGGFAMILLAVLTSGIAMFSYWLRDLNVGLLNWVHLPLFFETVLGVILYDLANYWIHRSQHMVPVLWRIHRAHHTDTYIDVTSAIRFHPFESVYRATLFAVFVGILGISPYSILGYGVMAATVLPISHANLRIPASWESWCQYGIVLPLQHRIHHSTQREEHDRNFGIVFLWWDHLFGTYLSPKKVSNLEIGLPGVSRARANGVVSLFREPFVTRGEAHESVA